MSPEEIYKLGLKMLNELYPQVSDVINKIGVHPEDPRTSCKV